MKLQFKNSITPAATPKPFHVDHFMPRGPSLLRQPQQLQPSGPEPETQSGIPGEGLPKALNYYADYGGCGLWRMVWPEMLLNGYQKAVINSLTVMVPIPNIYGTLDAVRIQRQASAQQYQFAEFLASQAKQYKFNLIYEIDDIIFPEDIPIYNMCRDGFIDPKLKENVTRIISMCNKFSVVSPYMRDYYADKLNIDPQKIIALPNYAPKFWLDRFYDHAQRMDNYARNKKKPRIGYCGSGTHFDVANRTLYNDDFSHVAQAVISTIDKFQWVFLGGLPPALKPYLQSGKVELFDWAPIYDYPAKMAELNLNAVVAPLAKNHFNNAKSNIKITEAGALGIPGVFQDLPCYQSLDVVRFTTGEEMVMRLLELLKDEQSYSNAVIACRKIAEANWLENHLDEHIKLFFDKSNT